MAEQSLAELYAEQGWYLSPESPYYDPALQDPVYNDTWAESQISSGQILADTNIKLPTPIVQENSINEQKDSSSLMPNAQILPINDFWKGINPFDDVPWHPFGDFWKGINPFDNVPWEPFGINMGSLTNLMFIMALSGGKNKSLTLPLIFLMMMNNTSKNTQTQLPNGTVNI